MLDSTMSMVLLCSIVLLVFAGGIHSSPVIPLKVISVCFDDDAVLNCNLTNDPSARVTLTRPSDPNNLPDNPGKITQDGTTFTIHNITVNDVNPTGRYQCVAERNNGKKITRDFLVHILDSRKADVAIIPFEAKRIVTGSDLKYTCRSTMGSMTWYRVISGSSSVALPSSMYPGISIKEQGEYQTDLVFSNAKFSHSGDYICELTYCGRGKTLDRMVSVDVLGPQPAKIVSTSNREVWAAGDKNGDCYKEDIMLVCNTAGFPSPIVTWTRDNQIITKCYFDEPCAKTERYIMFYNGLKIVTPCFGDDAVFRCEVQNAYGSDQREFVVVVPAAPVLKKSHSPYFWSQGQDKPIDIPCVLVQGSPTPNFTWFYRSCIPLPNNDKVCFQWMQKKRSFFQVRQLEKESHLIITHPQQMRLQFVNFKCTVENMKGKDEIVVDVLQKAGGKR